MRQVKQRFQSTTTRQRWLAFIIAVLLGLAWFVLASQLTDKVRLPFISPTAEMYISGLPPETYLNQTAEVDVHLKSERSAVNAVSAVVNVNPAMVEIVGMSTEQSFCSLYLENSFNARKGEVRVACGTPQPGFSGDSVIVRLKLRFRQPGQTNLTIDRSQSQALANDPAGADILVRSTTQATVRIKQSI